MNNIANIKFGMKGEHSVEFVFSREQIEKMIHNYWAIGDYLILRGLASLCEIEYHEHYGERHV